MTSRSCDTPTYRQQSCFVAAAVTFTVIMLLKRIPDVSQLNVGIKKKNIKAPMSKQNKNEQNKDLLKNER